MAINEQFTRRNAAEAMAKVFAYLAARRYKDAARWARKLILWLTPVAEGRDGDRTGAENKG